MARDVQKSLGLFLKLLQAELGEMLGRTWPRLPLDAAPTGE